MLFPFETSISQNQTLELRDNVCFFIIYLLQICQLIKFDGIILRFDWSEKFKQTASVQSNEKNTNTRQNFQFIMVLTAWHFFPFLSFFSADTVNVMELQETTGMYTQKYIANRFDLFWGCLQGTVSHWAECLKCDLMSERKSWRRTV